MEHLDTPWNWSVLKYFILPICFLNFSQSLVWLSYCMSHKVPQKLQLGAWFWKLFSIIDKVHTDTSSCHTPLENQLANIILSSHWGDAHSLPLTGIWFSIALNAQECIIQIWGASLYLALLSPTSSFHFLIFIYLNFFMFRY